MKNILIIMVLTFSAITFCSDTIHDKLKTPQVAIEVLQATIKRDGIPYSPELIDYCCNTPTESYFPQTSTIAMVGLGIVGTYTFINNIMGWRPVVAEAVHVASQGVAILNEQKKEDAKAVKVLQDTRKAVDDLSLQQLELLAITEASSNKESTFFRDKFNHAVSQNKNIILNNN